MTPVHGTAVLLVIAAVAVAVLLALIIGAKMHAFVALVLVSFGTAVAAGVPLADVPLVATDAFGSTLGEVALLVGLGVMIGRVLEPLQADEQGMDVDPALPEDRIAALVLARLAL